MNRHEKDSKVDEKDSKVMSSITLATGSTSSQRVTAVSLWGIVILQPRWKEVQNSGKPRKILLLVRTTET